MFALLRTYVAQVVEHSTVDSCVRMLLRWQGAYDGARVDAAACRLPDCMSDMLLMSDTPDWAPDALLPLLQVRKATQHGKRAGRVGQCGRLSITPVP